MASPLDRLLGRKDPPRTAAGYPAVLFPSRSRLPAGEVNLGPSFAGDARLVFPSGDTATVAGNSSPIYREAGAYIVHQLQLDVQAGVTARVLLDNQQLYYSPGDEVGEQTFPAGKQPRCKREARVEFNNATEDARRARVWLLCEVG